MPMHAPDTLPLAQLRGVHKRDGAVVALDGVDLQLQRGQLLALLGANGAGKSTAVALMLGLQVADAGSAQLCGQDPRALGARRQAGVMLQSAGLPDTLRVGELLDQVRGYYRRPRSAIWRKPRRWQTGSRCRSCAVASSSARSAAAVCWLRRRWRAGRRCAARTAATACWRSSPNRPSQWWRNCLPPIRGWTNWKSGAPVSPTHSSPSSVRRLHERFRATPHRACCSASARRRGTAVPRVSVAIARGHCYAMRPCDRPRSLP